jgi:hypothetical protein
MTELIAGLQGHTYVWDIGRVHSPLSPIGILYTIGYPAVLAGDIDAAGTWPRVEAMK